MKRLIPDLTADCPGYSCMAGTTPEISRKQKKPWYVAQGSLYGVRRHVATLYRAAAMEALRKGRGDLSVALLVNGVRSCKRGPAKRRLMSVSNGFGMVHRGSFEEDAQHAFFGVQLSRYLARKRTRRIATPAEADMLLQLLLESWEEQRKQVVDSDAAPTELLEAFAGVRIVFPYVELPPDFRDPVIEVDFDRGERVQPERSCWCGSGLSHFRCHGRIPGAAELGIGRFWPSNSR